MSKGINKGGNDSAKIIERQIRELSTLVEMNKKIHSTMKMDRLLQILVKQAVIGVDFERGLIYLLEGDFLRCVASLDRVKKEKGSIIKALKGFKMDETAVEVRAVQTGKSFYVKDARTDKRVSRKLLKVTDTREYCVVALKSRSGILGVLTGDKVYSQSPIRSEDIRTLELFAGHIGLAIENAALFEEKERFAIHLEERISERTMELAQANEQLQTKMKELSTLFKISGNLNKNLGVDEALKLILSLVNGLGYSMCAVHLWEDGEFGKAVQMGMGRQYLKTGFPALRTAIGERILKDGENILLSELQTKLKSIQYYKHIFKMNVHSALILPLRAKNDLIGMIIILITRGRPFGKEQEAFFSAFRLQASMALENALAIQKIIDQKNRMENLSRRLEQENICLREKMKAEQAKKFVIGKSPAMNKVMDMVHRVAPTNTSVIVYGETETGKELIANAIHEIGPRKLKPMIKVNCAAIPEALLESELFGHEKGAFTGAHERKIGMFLLAQGGTLFMDEIGDISLKTQTKLLRVLQENEIQPLGLKNIIKVDVRVIAATNKDLKKMIQDETFRSDLFYRLNVFPITVPPLRDRREDIPMLVDFFLTKYAHLKKNKVGIDRNVIQIFLKYSWPGNIRELENIIERLMIISGPGKISVKDLPRELSMDTPEGLPVRPLKEAVFDFKIELVRQALAESAGKKAGAASMLGMPKSNFSRLLRQLGIR